MIQAALFSLALFQTPVDPDAIRSPPPVGFDFASEPDLQTLHQAFGARVPEGGRVSMQCEVLPDGGLSTCTIREERPEGRDIGPIALGLTDRYRVLDPDHRLVGRKIRFAIYWPAVDPGR